MEREEDSESERRVLSQKIRRSHPSLEPISKRQRFSSTLASAHHRSLSQATKEAALINQTEELVLGNKSKKTSYGLIEHIKKPRLNICACHICRRKPTQTNELETYTNCERCLEITCTICIRKCAGNKPIFDKMASETRFRARLFQNNSQSGGHFENICSRCSVEKGVEGEIWCLGCLNAGI